MSSAVDEIVLYFLENFKVIGVKFTDPDYFHKVYFVQRRAESLAKQCPSWAAEPDQPKIRHRLQAEIASVGVYLYHKIGTYESLGPLITGKYDQSPNHLDLEQVAKVTKSIKSSIVTKKRIENRFSRYDLVQNIVWRATAIHDDLWKISSVDLEDQALDELVDRRLRTVERLIYNVNSGEISKRRRKWQVAGSKGPWKDGQLLRIFEYPELPKEFFIAYKDEMEKDYWIDTGISLVYGLPFRVAPAVNTEIVAFRDIQSGYIHPKLKPNKYTPAKIFELMFTPSEDFWQRNWLYCDQVAAAVNVEALRFALLRREGNDNTFNAGMQEDYVYLTGLLSRHGSRNIGVLMADNADPFFENTEIDMNDLQVGDELIFWNHPLYQITDPGGAYRNEYSYVVSVENHPFTGDVRQKKLFLTGHGIKTTSYAGMAKELTDCLKGNLKDLLDRINRQLAVDPKSDKLSHRGEVVAVKWAPYGESFDPPGAWWRVIPNKIWKNVWEFSTAADAVMGVPRTVMKDEHAGSGYVAPPVDEDSILFPLYEPAFGEKDPDGDSWNVYLVHRRTSDKAAPKKLRPLEVDGRLAPGLFYRGKKFPIPVIRPKVRK